MKGANLGRSFGDALSDILESFRASPWNAFHSGASLAYQVLAGNFGNRIPPLDLFLASSRRRCSAS
jgi:hypothetical protein